MPTIETVKKPAPTDTGDHDKFSHYVNKKEITDAYVFGTPLIALCGKTWVPSSDPNRFPICPDCVQRLDDEYPAE